MIAQIVRLQDVGRKSEEGYRFIERDPVVDDLMYCMDRSGMTDAQIAARAMCAWQTVHAIRVKTKRPQNYTCDRIFKVCGFKRVLMTKAGVVVRRRK